MKLKVGKITKRVLLAIAVIVLALTIAYWELVVYGLRQGRGQLNIVWNAKPVEDFIKDPSFPDSLKTKLRLIEQIRRYAIDSLALKDTKNYKTLYDQKGEEIMWVVTACKPFSLEPKEWTFPVVGSVPYKGFFKKRLAFELREQLMKEGWDVSIRNPGGWSTLGWFTDPILSKMLERSEGDLANLIIHEMSHATIFVKDSIDFNENLATFIGDRGAERFLESKYGKDSKEYREYINEDKDYLKFADHMLRGSRMLDSLYKTMNAADDEKVKKELKQAMIQKIVLNLDTIHFSTTNKKPSSRFEKQLPNNAYFMNFLRYQARQDDFTEVFERDFHSDLRAFIIMQTKKHPFL
jgi:predicted aminopeptidase